MKKFCIAQVMKKEMVMMSTKPCIQDFSAFLSDYAAYLLGCGATCIRIEKNVERIAHALGFQVDMSILPTHVVISVHDAILNQHEMSVTSTHKCGISFHINTLLSQLSWSIADGKLTFDQAQEEYSKIIQTQPANKWWVLGAASVANASFCQLFGGDWVAILIVLVSTLIGFRLKQILMEDKMDIRFIFFICALVSSVVSSIGSLMNWGSTPEIALATSVLYLIPGIPYINSVSDMLDGHYLCSFSRLTNAVVLTACLSLGLCGGLFLLGFQWFT